MDTQDNLNKLLYILIIIPDHIILIDINVYIHYKGFILATHFWCKRIKSDLGRYIWVKTTTWWVGRDVNMAGNGISSAIDVEWPWCLRHMRGWEKFKDDKPKSTLTHVVGRIGNEGFSVRTDHMFKASEKKKDSWQKQCEVPAKGLWVT